MFETICSLPLTSNLTTLALHPTTPLFAVGLASGHIQTYRLPDSDGVAAHHGGSRPAAPPRAGFVGGKPARRSSDGGVSTIDTAWRTRRHKGSCRALAYSGDGAALYSAGVDGVVKAASAETGQVFSKVLVPRGAGAGAGAAPAVEPMVMAVLSPQTLLLATDAGEVHVFDLRAGGGRDGVAARPQGTLRPHGEKGGDGAGMAIESLAVLPPSGASTSGTARQWVSTAGGTVAACDVRKGVVGCSRDQGDVLTCCTVVDAKSIEGGKRSKDGSVAVVGAGERVAVGSSDGLLSLFKRGEWDDHHDRMRLVGQDLGIECMAAAPASVVEGPGTVAVGTEDGRVMFRKALSSGKRQTSGSVVSHDDTGVEGVAAIGFDVAGRMITGGGEIVKVWFDNGLRQDAQWPGGVLADDAEEGEHDEGEDEVEDEEDDEEADEDGVVGDGVDESEEDSEEDSEEEKRRRPHKKQKKDGSGKKGAHGHHGILAFNGMT